MSVTKFKKYNTMKTCQLKINKKVLVIIYLMLFSSSLTFSQGQFDITQTLSDGAQGHTIAFDGLAFLTGNFCACSFIPPGKVADYFGFQYMRDNDVTQMGHNSDFQAVVSNNLLYVLDSAQKALIVSVAQTQVPMISQYAYDRFPLIDAFIRMRDNNMPTGSPGLDKQAIKNYSAQLYRLDGRISIQRAQLYATIINALNLQQKHYLDSIYALGMQNMPVLPLQIDKTHLTNNEFVAVMTFAGDIYSWYVGNTSADVYFCPERQGNYFGGFYVKDAPAMGNPNYSIDTTLTQNGGQRFLDALTVPQALLITELVDTQRTVLYTLFDRRTDISNLLRGYLVNNTVDTSAVLNLSETYGALDGEISYYYATNFSKVNWTLTSIQRDTLDSIRNLNDFPCVGAYLYSDTIGVPNFINTDFFFLSANGINENLNAQNFNENTYPNPFSDKINLKNTSGNENFELRNALGQTIWTGSQIEKQNFSTLSPGLYFLKVYSKNPVQAIKLIKK